ncbi:stage III sporulation protein AE [Desulfurispora thermophila]|uniref:stage III sporulation protein AE n=1 Tax=Desulfurispora thermophila TaxID=265470 RepID=UPI0003705248|nr:stage III sporulation protein AE [Desulfurispora thermophila]
MTQRYGLLLILLGVFWLLARTPVAEATDLPAVSQSAAGQLDMQEIEDYIGRLDRDVKSYLPEFDFSGLVHALARRDLDLGLEKLFGRVLDLMLGEVRANIALLSKLLVLALICLLLSNLGHAFRGGEAGETAHLVVYLVLAIIALGSFSLAVNTCREVVDKMVSFMQALLPVLLTLLVAVGGAGTTALLQPVLFVAISIIATLVKNVVLPLILLAAVLGVSGGLSRHFYTGKLAGLFKSASLGLLGLFGTLFLGVLSLAGVAGAVGDGLLIRTAKYATDAFVPVVGGMFADVLETLVSTVLWMKNAVGIAGVVVILAMVLLPLLKVLALYIIYRLSGALLQPLGDGRVVDCLSELAGSLLLVFAALSTVCLMFFFAVAAVVALGNLTVMLR